MAGSNSQLDAKVGSGVDIRDYRRDSAALSPEDFEEQHGGGFLLLTASRLQDPNGPSSTVVELGDVDEPTASRTAGLSTLAYAVQRTGRSVGHLVTLGRASNNDVVIPDQSVSRFHAFLKQGDGGRFHLQDANSTNGTTVNRESVPAQGHGSAVELKAGDNVRLGQVELTFLNARSFQTYVRELAG